MVPFAKPGHPFSHQIYIFDMGRTLNTFTHEGDVRIRTLQRDRRVPYRRHRCRLLMQATIDWESLSRHRIFGLEGPQLHWMVAYLTRLELESELEHPASQPSGPVFEMAQSVFQVEARLLIFA
jgi:hypothetical protein